jgi:hypothetical protein
VSIEALVDLEAMTHLANHGCIKGMDPYAQHLLKTSNHPLMRFRRDWIRREALRQCLEAEREQKEMNKQLAASPVRRGAPIRRAAVLHPYFAAQMPKAHKTTWNDPGFIASVKRDSPGCFPKRIN